MANIDLSKVRKDYLALISIGLIALLALFAYMKIFSPLFFKIKSASRQVEQKRSELERARISPDALRKLEREMAAITKEAEFYQDRLNVNIDVPQILKELNQLGEQLGVRFVAVKPLSAQQRPLPGNGQLLIEIPIQLRLECGYHQLGIFINQIENSTRLMKVTELKVSATACNTWAHNAELVISNYMLVNQ